MHILTHNVFFALDHYQSVTWILMGNLYFFVFIYIILQVFVFFIPLNRFESFSDIMLLLSSKYIFMFLVVIVQWQKLTLLLLVGMVVPNTVPYVHCVCQSCAPSLFASLPGSEAHRLAISQDLRIHLSLPSQCCGTGMYNCA